MTCIAGVVSNGKVWIGGDSAGVNSSEHLQLRRDSKVFKNGEYLIGVSGSWRRAQELRFALLPQAPALDHKMAPTDSFEFMVRKFLPALRKMVEGTYSPVDDFELLVGFRGRLFHVYDTSQVSEEIADFEACGSGAQVARGSMFSSKFTDPARKITEALQAAERFCSGVRGPFNILDI